MWPAQGNVPGGFAIPQWPLNPAAYQNIPYDKVDWATLAQQWIKMKETVQISPNTKTTEHLPPPMQPVAMQAPPAPVISGPEPLPPVLSESIKESSKSTSQTISALKHTSQKDKNVSDGNDIEGGEAPMDMDTKDDEATAPSQMTAGGGTWNQWNNWQSSQWGWGWPGNTGTVPLAPDMQSGSTAVDCKVKVQNTDSIPVFNNFVAGVPNFPIVGNTGTTKLPPSTGFTAATVGNNISTPSQINQRFGIHAYKNAAGKLYDNKSHKSDIHTDLSLLDAAKRKQLPAWIRDGLNKMEREKQRKIEKEHTDREMKFQEANAYTNEDEPPGIIFHQNEAAGDGMSTRTLSTENVVSPKSRKSRFNDAYEVQNISKAPSPLAPAIRKTKDQLLTETMLKVRRILTEILLDCTASQVQSIAKEEYFKAKSAARGVQLRKSTALASLSKNFGLSEYGSDSDKSDESADEADSDEYLKNLIEKKKRSFKRVEDEIEKEIENEELREQRIMQQENEPEESGESASDGDGEEIYHNTKHQSDRKGIQVQNQFTVNDKMYEPHINAGEKSNTPVDASHNIGKLSFDVSNKTPILPSSHDKILQNDSNSIYGNATIKSDTKSAILPTTDNHHSLSDDNKSRTLSVAVNNNTNLTDDKVKSANHNHSSVKHTIILNEPSLPSNYKFNQERVSTGFSNDKSSDCNSSEEENTESKVSTSSPSSESAASSQDETESQDEVVDASSSSGESTSSSNSSGDGTSDSIDTKSNASISRSNSLSSTSSSDSRKRKRKRKHKESRKPKNYDRNVNKKQKKDGKLHASNRCTSDDSRTYSRNRSHSRDTSVSSTYKSIRNFEPEKIRKIDSKSHSKTKSRDRRYKDSPKYNDIKNIRKCSKIKDSSSYKRDKYRSRSRSIKRRSRSRSTKRRSRSRSTKCRSRSRSTKRRSRSRSKKYRSSSRSEKHRSSSRSYRHSRSSSRSSRYHKRSISPKHYDTTRSYRTSSHKKHHY